MGTNKGKAGEMTLAVVVASIGSREDGVDFTRPSITNSADMGADVFLVHPQCFLEETLLPKANGTYQLPSVNILRDAESLGARKTPQKTRIDMKEISSKLGKGTVEKFIADIPKHPDCTGHLLAGGFGLTGPAEKIFVQAKKDFQEHGKVLAHLTYDGLRRLGAYYPPPVFDLDHNFSQDNVLPNDHNGKDPGTI